MKTDRQIAVIGAGVAGLATAARLASKGFNVDVYEKLPECGGRAHIIEDQGFKFDTGPSFVLMPSFFKEVFTYCGENVDDYLDLKTLETNYKIHYADGDALTVFKDNAKTKTEFEKSEKNSSAAYDKFLSETAALYKTVQPLLYKCFTAKDLVNPKLWPLLIKLKPFQTYWQIAKKYFKSDKLCYAMTFEAMFIGLSPFITPSFYSVITYTDHVEKVAHPMGGMYQIPKALEKMGRKFGVKFHYDTEINKIIDNDNHVTLVSNKGEFAADKVVINADFSYAKESLLNDNLPKYQYSCSVYLLYLGLREKIPGVEHHNLFFASDLKRNLKEIFDEKTPSSDPSFYIHAPTVTDPSLAPEGKEILYILVPVGNLEKAPSDNNFLDESIRNIVFDKINQTYNVNLEELIDVEHRFYPDDFIKRYNIKYGATFGLAHTLMQSAFFRPANYSNKHKNIYHVGASTQPGGGLPPVLASSRIVADLITSA